MERASFFSLLANRAGNYATLLVTTSHVIIINKDIEVEAMNLTACKLAQKLVCLEEIEKDKFDVVFGSVESATDKRFYHH